MNTGRHAPWPRLALLTVIVLAAHLVLLEPARLRVQPPAPRAVAFATRHVAPVPIVAIAEMPPRTTLAPATISAPAPRPLLPAALRAPATTPVPSAPAAALASAPAPAPTLAATPLPRILTPLPSARLHYEVSAQSHGAPVAGEALLDWHHDGQQYEAVLEVSGPGLTRRTQRSAGRIAEGGLVPGYFADKARGEQATHFDRANGRLVFSNNRPQVMLADGMQDRLSVIVQLAMVVGAQPARFPAGTQIALPTASTREADLWIFDVEGEEDLVLPGGEVHALKLQRLPRREFDQKIELWLAPGMDYAPVRLRLTNPNGGAVDHRWSSTDRD
jgi:hypothetical protein